MKTVFIYKRSRAALRWSRSGMTAVSVAVLLSCSSSAPPAAPAASDNVVQTMQLNVTAVDTTFVTRDHFIATVEMQLSGEPFAEAMGRDLAGYSRDFVCQSSLCSPDIYHDPALNGGVAGGVVGRTDTAGYSSAVESYEYSKQPMNNIAFESGAGTALLFGPVLNPNGAVGAAGLQGLRDWEQRLAVEANTTARAFRVAATPGNPIGWPGFWPTLQPFTQWDPTIHASNASTGCTISSDDDPGASGSLHCDDYECDYTTLNLPDRSAQVNMTIGPGASGWAGWKEALWTLNYLQVMHDANENAVDSVPDDQLALVGTAGNTVLGDGGQGGGTFLGSSDIEGFQAGNFLQILDNSAWKALHWRAIKAASNGERAAWVLSIKTGKFARNLCAVNLPHDAGFNFGPCMSRNHIALCAAARNANRHCEPALQVSPAADFFNNSGQL